MNDPLLIVSVSETKDDGQNFYRVSGPGRALSRIAGVKYVECDPLHRWMPVLTEAADILILHVFHAEQLALFARRRSANRVTVLEVSDDTNDLQPWNPNSFRWLDRTAKDQFQCIARAVDALQVTSPELAGVVGDLNRHTAVFGNHLESVPPLIDKPGDSDGPLIVGWAGSLTHLADWFEVAPSLEHWLLQRPDIQLAVMTNERAKSFIGLSADRYHFRVSGSLEAYIGYVTKFDIGLAPLSASAFSRSRTDLKFLEYAALGVPAVYADYGPYHDSVQHEQTGLLYRTMDEMIDCLEALRTKPKLRRNIRQKAHALVSARPNVNDFARRRLDFYLGLFRGPRTRAKIPDEIEAVIQESYTILTKGPTERVLAHALTTTPTMETARALQSALTATPTFAPGFQFLGALLNELGAFGDALTILQRSYRLDNHNLRTLCELARAYLGLNDPATAMAYLNEVLTQFPRHVLGWQLLVQCANQLGRIESDWVEKARTLPTDQYLVALTALRLLPPPEALDRCLELLLACKTMHPEELPYAAIAFGTALELLSTSDVEDTAFHSVMEIAARTFPSSARMADIFGQWCFRANRIAESECYFQRAGLLRRTALAYQLEYSDPHDQVTVWQVAEYLASLRQTDH